MDFQEFIKSSTSSRYSIGKPLNPNLIGSLIKSENVKWQKKEHVQREGLNLDLEKEGVRKFVTQDIESNFVSPTLKWEKNGKPNAMAN